MKKFFRLKNDIVLFDDENIEQLDNMFKSYKIKDNSFSLPIYEIFNVSSLRDNFNLSLDSKIENIITDIKNYQNLSVSLNSTPLSLMKPYQINAYNG